jgi:hypothetical protein
LPFVQPLPNVDHARHGDARSGKERRLAQGDRPDGHDAIVLIPGIMGSALRDTDSGHEIWGLKDPRWYASAWLTGGSIEKLAVTDDERAGRVGRVAVTGLLRAAAWAPFLRGVEPYHKMGVGLRHLAVDPAAVCEFAYDWRLSVAHNADALARTAEAHLQSWQTHPRGSADAKLILVAHSMGGLIARYFTHVLGHADQVRRTITLGTPYYGSVKAAVILNTGRGAPVPLPAARLRNAARTMPGLHDLLPFYRCVDDGRVGRHLDPRDVSALGGDGELAAESRARHAKLLDGEAGRLRLLVGTDQPTWQSLSLADGVLQPRETEMQVDADGRVVARRDRRGDGTVYRRAAAAFDLEPSPLPQDHGILAATSEAIGFVRDVVSNHTSGPPLGGEEGVGVRVPDIHPVTEPLHIDISGAGLQGTRCAVIDVASNQTIAVPAVRRADDHLAADVDLPLTGLLRVEAKAGGRSAVISHVMAIPPDTPMVDTDA